MSSLQNKPVGLGVVGLGGWAKCVTDTVLNHGRSTSPVVELIAVADPAVATFPERASQLRQRRVAVMDDFANLLCRDGVEALWLPVPIGLHRPCTERALAAGKAVLCEKPAAGSIQDVDAMIRARDRAGRPAAIAFQLAADPGTLTLKRRLLAGDIGRLRAITLRACWPRPRSYYRRNQWAGKWQHDGAWVMDSPANNALAHPIQLGLFLAGAELDGTARHVAVEAELYRGNDIENFDTISVRAKLDTGVECLVLLTHACESSVDPIMCLEGEAGRVVWTLTETRLEVGSRVEQVPRSAQVQVDLLERFARLVRGVPDPRRTIATLESARAQVELVNAASLATPVRPVPATHLRRLPREGDEQVVIPGIEAAFAQAAVAHQMLHETGRLPFTTPAGRFELSGFTQFDGPRRR